MNIPITSRSNPCSHGLGCHALHLTLDFAILVGHLNCAMHFGQHFLQLFPQHQNDMLYQGDIQHQYKFGEYNPAEITTSSSRYLITLDYTITKPVPIKYVYGMMQWFLSILLFSAVWLLLYFVSMCNNPEKIYQFYSTSIRLYVYGCTGLC